MAPIKNFERVCVRPKKVRCGKTVYDAHLITPGQKRMEYICRRSDKAEAQSLADQYLATPKEQRVKPAKVARIIHSSMYCATIKKPRVNLSGERRWDIVGRVGNHDKRHYVTVGTFCSEEEAKEAAAKFDLTGEVQAGRPRPEGVSKPVWKPTVSKQVAHPVAKKPARSLRLELMAWKASYARVCGMNGSMVENEAEILARIEERRAA